MNSKWINFFERVGWTIIQGASAEVELQIIQAIWGPIDNYGLWLVVLTGANAAIKNAAAQAFGFESGATLPESVAPVLPDRVAALAKNDQLIAGKASTIKTGKAVEVWPIEAGHLF